MERSPWYVLGCCVIFPITISRRKRRQWDSPFLLTVGVLIYVTPISIEVGETPHIGVENPLANVKPTDRVLPPRTACRLPPALSPRGPAPQRVPEAHAPMRVASERLVTELEAIRDVRRVARRRRAHQPLAARPLRLGSFAPRHVQRGGGETTPARMHTHASSEKPPARRIS